jgi:hypothetical protein
VQLVKHLTLIFLLVLVGCDAPSRSPQGLPWTKETVQPDPMTDNMRACTETTSTNRVGGEQAVLQVCRPGEFYTVTVTLAEHRFHCGEPKGELETCVLVVRFDNRPQHAQFGILKRWNTHQLFVSEPNKLVKEMRDAKTFRLLASITDLPDQIMEFQVSNPPTVVKSDAIYF